MIPIFLSANKFRQLAFAGVFFVCAISANAQIGVALTNSNGQYLVAARAGNIALATEYLKNGAAVDSRDRNGDTPLQFAARKGDAAMVKLLLSRGANVNFANLSGVTPLMAAAFAGQLEILKMLLAAGASIDPTDRVKKTAAIYAAGNGHTACVLSLLDAGAKVDERNENDTTLLMWAASYGHDGAVQALVVVIGDVVADDAAGLVQGQRRLGADAVALEGAMPAFDLAVGLRIIGRG